VRADARKYIPVPIADVTLDWAEISVNSETTGSRDVLLAAIQNDALKRFMSLMQTVELPAPTNRESSVLVTIRSAYEQTSPHVAVIDIGASVSKLYITESGLLARMHRVPVGGVKVTERIMAERQMLFTEAEQLKHTVTTAESDYAQIQKNYPCDIRTSDERVPSGD
jgi:Tfp pilus assembly PilM family ATPase